MSNSQTTSTLSQGASSQSAPAQGPGTVTTSTTPLDAASGVASNSAQTTNPVVQSNHPQSAPVEQGTVTSVTPAASNATTAVASNSTNTANTAAQPGYTGSPPAEASRNVTSATTGMADTTNAIASNSTGSATTVDPANPPSAPKSAEESKSTNALRRATDPARKTVQNRAAVSPGRFPNAESLPNQQPEQAAAAAGNPKTSTEPASAANAGTNRTPTQSSDSVAQQPARKKFALHEVRRAEPVEPEARSAGAVSPEEGPGTSAPEKTTSSQPRTNSPAQVEAGRDVETETGENTARSGKPTDSEPKVATRPRTNPERPAKSKRPMDDGIYPPQPMPESAGPWPHATRKPFRGRFIGVTPDGMWMFRLPSNRIVIVPPPDR